MAKRKKKSAQLATQGFGTKKITSRQLDKKLRQAADYAEIENWPGALGILVPLSQQCPEERSVWEFLSDASFESGDMRLYQKACERLFEITGSGDYAYLLGSAYLHNMHPLMALHTWRQALALDPKHEITRQVRKQIKQLEPMEQEALANLGLTGPEGLNIARQHERGQVYLEQGEYREARQAEEVVLERDPDFIPARNNLSLISWMEKNVDLAIATAQEVLERDPDNIHALSNLIHFLVLSGDADGAKPYAERLKTSHADAWDGWTKKVEGLSYFGDDAGVVEVWQQAQAEKIETTAANAQFYHLSAVALARVGEEKKAIAQWKKALARNPSLLIAKENLKDIRNPIGQRHGAWPFAWRQWLMPDTAEKLNKLMMTSVHSKKMDKVINQFGSFFKSHSDFVAMLPRLLERGGPDGQGFLVSTIEQIKTPELIAILKDFALSQSGPDRMRFQAAKLAEEVNLMPAGTVSLWMGGAWRDMMLKTFTFHDEPPSRHSKAVEALAKPAFFLLQQGGKAQAIKAERLLREAISLTTEAAPDLMNNLAMSLAGQGRNDEADALNCDIVARYPDYIFASVNLAQQYLAEGDLEATEEILKPFLSRDRFHVMEFGGFSAVYIGLLVAKKQQDAARSWFDVWENVCPSDPNLAYWRPQLKKGFRHSKLFG
ncbi:MAG: tetratricopeptide repeat protein [Phormidesmis sp.]